MRKLLSAHFARLWKDRYFWLAMAFMTIGAVLFSWMSYDTSMKNASDLFYVEDMMFNLLPMLGFVCAVFISMYVGTEFDEHTIRNKMVVGHTRTQVFFGEYVTCLAASLLFLLAILLFSGGTGCLIFREFLLGGLEIAYLVFCCVLLTAVFSAMAVGINMNGHSKASSLVVSVLFLFAILMLASYCINALEEEPMIYSYVNVTVDSVQLGDMVENPSYIDGFQRTVYELIADLLPTGQTIQLNNLEYERIGRWPMLSVIMLLVSTAAGYLPFRKRDIK